VRTSNFVLGNVNNFGVFSCVFFGQIFSKAARLDGSLTHVTSSNLHRYFGVFFGGGGGGGAAAAYLDPGRLIAEVSRTHSRHTALDRILLYEGSA